MTDQSDQLDFNQDFVEAARNMRRQAEQTERGRNAALLSAAERAARQYGDRHVADILDDCRKAILIPGTRPIFGLMTEPPPPAPEPLTVEKFMEKLTAGWPVWNDGADVEADLRSLVWERARRDAEIVRNSPECSFNEHIANNILKSAGLDAEVTP